MKILIPAEALVCLICLILGITSYRNINSGMVGMGVEQANMAALVTLNVIDGDALEKIQPGGESGEEYQTLLASMRAMQETCGIAFLYTLYTDGNTVYYGVDTDTSAGQSAVGDEFEVPYSELADVFAGTPYVQDYIDSTSDGDLISVYEPITDSSGKIVGVLGCDYDASSVVKRLNTILMQVIIIAVVCMVLAFVLLHLIVGRITRSLRMVDRKIYDLVHSEGDLTRKLDIRTGDEMELIADNVNSLLEYIRGIMVSIAGNSIQLNSSSKSVVKDLSDAELSITDVSATMQQMSASMEETSVAIGGVNHSISDVYHAIEAISTSAEAGRKSSDETMKKAAGIYEMAEREQQNARLQAQEMAAVVNEKIEKSKAVQEIGALTDNIINITEQTNLLSLNASIEAARAGEAGRGFAVVAGEIGKLAADSAETATRIQKVSAEVVEAVNELAREAEAMLNFLDETAMNGYEKLLETSGNYRSDVGVMNEMMSGFAEESRLLKNNIDNIKEAISDVNAAVEESAKGVENVTEVSVNLTANVSDIGNEANSNMDIADQLNQEVHKFKLE